MYESGRNIGNLPDCPDCEVQEKANKMLTDRITRIVWWLVENQPDVFRRGLWDAIDGKYNAPVTDVMDQDEKQVDEVSRPTPYRTLDER